MSAKRMSDLSPSQRLDFCPFAPRSIGYRPPARPRMPDSHPHSTSAAAPATTASAPHAAAAAGHPRCLAIVPVFNERGSVGKVIERLRRALPEVDVLVI